MRKNKGLDALFPKTRQRILGTLLFDPSRSWYLSELARSLGVSPSSLQRELGALVEAGVLERAQDGNRVTFQADPHCPFLGELRGLFLKTAGLRDPLETCLLPFRARIDVAFIHGSMARSQERSASDVDLMVIGDVGLSEIVMGLREVEKLLGRPVNPSVYSRAEVVKKLRAGHHFLESVLGSDKIVILGDERDLESIVGESPSRSPPV